MATMKKSHNTALAVLPAPDSGVAALAAALGATEAPRITLLFPFVERDAFEDTATQLLPLMRRQPVLGIQLSADIAITQSGKAWLLQLVPESMVDTLMGLSLVCEDAAPACTDIGDRDFEARLTVGTFPTKEDAESAVAGIFWEGGQLYVDRVALLSRATAADDFVHSMSVGLGTSGAIEFAPSRPPAVIAATHKPLPPHAPELMAAIYQCDQRAGFVRVSFALDEHKAAVAASGGSNQVAGAPAPKDKMLFVVDHSYSMMGSYRQVKSAVRHMIESAGDDEPDFVLYRRHPLNIAVGISFSWMG
eukprot:COSAG01_NODE_5596_length_4157_cov_253.600296_2_plen_305_part_00